MEWTKKNDRTDTIWAGDINKLQDYKADKDSVVQIWNPGVQYNVGDRVFLDYDPDSGNKYHGIFVCTKSHISRESPEYDSTWQSYDFDYAYRSKISLGASYLLSEPFSENQEVISATEVIFATRFCRAWGSIVYTILKDILEKNNLSLTDYIDEENLDAMIEWFEHTYPDIDPKIFLPDWFLKEEAE